MNALGMRSDLRKRLNRRMDEVFLRAGHDAKNRKKTDRRMEFVFVATRRNSHEAVDVNVDPRQVRQGVDFQVQLWCIVDGWKGSYSYLLNRNARCQGSFNQGTACGSCFCTFQGLGLTWMKNHQAST